MSGDRSLPENDNAQSLAGVRPGVRLPAIIKKHARVAPVLSYGSEFLSGSTVFTNGNSNCFWVMLLTQ